MAPTSSRRVVKAFAGCASLLILVALTTIFPQSNNNGILPSELAVSVRQLLQATEPTCRLRLQDKFDCEESGCQDQTGGFFNHLLFYYCACDASIGVALLFFIPELAALLFLLGDTADEFFSPVLQQLATNLNMSDNLAGVTLLALGTAAPDIGTIYASFQGQDGKLGIGSVIGSSFFIGAFSVGAVVFVEEFTVPARTFLRDCGFSFLGFLYLIVVMQLGNVTVLKAIGFFAIFFLFISIVWYQEPQSVDDAMDTTKRTWCVDDDESENRSTSNQSTVSLPGESRSGSNQSRASLPGKSRSSSNQSRASLLVQTLLQSGKAARPPHVLDNMSFHEVEDDTRLSGFIEALDVIEKTHTLSGFIEAEWNEVQGLTSKGKCFYVIEQFFWLPRRISVPLIDDKWWNPYFVVVNPLFAVPLLALGFFELEWDASTISILLGVGLAMSAVSALSVYRMENPFTPPTGLFQKFLLAFGFVMSIVWILIVADILVDQLNAIGLIIGLSEQILGITVLAMGNSLPDLVLGVTLARDGLPLMAVSGAYASPFYNITVGVGLPLLMKSLTEDASFNIKDNSVLFIVASAFLAHLFVVTLTVVPFALKFTFSRRFAYYLILNYAVFLLVCTLAEANVFG